MTNIKKLVILHSNDLHGDFLAKGGNAQQIGGVSMLSGYINKTRKKEKNVIYAIAGDMFQGSIIDTEYKGISTIEIMNLLAPDIVSLGNHEMDYGASHLLFLEKCATFPIISANLYINKPHIRMFSPYIIREIDGMKILFIGIITEEILSVAKLDPLIGTLLDVTEAANEVGKICNVFQTEDVDFTVVMTHIGIENDRRLAALLNPTWGVDIIIGGHSHTLLEKPDSVNGVLIVQAEMGTAQIGRFDIEVDIDNNCMHNYNWQLIPIDAQHCPRDVALEDLIHNYKDRTDEKYSRVLTRSIEQLTHPRRNCETTMGNLFSDIFKNCLELDVMLLGSGSLRKKELPLIITHKDLAEVFPYDDSIYRIYVTGKLFRQMMKHMLRKEALVGDEHAEFYQVSDGIELLYNVEKEIFTKFNLNDTPIKDEDVLRIGFQSYHYTNMGKSFNLSDQDLSSTKPRIVATSAFDIIDEWLCETDLIKTPALGRIVIE